MPFGNHGSMCGPTTPQRTTLVSSMCLQSRQASMLLLNDSVSHLQPYLLSTQLYPQQPKSTSRYVNKTINNGQTIYNKTLQKVDGTSVTKGCLHNHQRRRRHRQIHLRPLAEERFRIWSATK